MILIKELIKLKKFMLKLDGQLVTLKKRVVKKDNKEYTFLSGHVVYGNFICPIDLRSDFSAKVGDKVSLNVMVKYDEYTSRVKYIQLKD